MLVIRHSGIEGPGYFASYLERRSISQHLIALDSGEALPRGTRRYAGVVLMGGPMSANDDLPWIPLVLELIRDAVRNDLPLLGHCLGGQLLSKALGGEVKAAPVKEIGWGAIQVSDNEVARAWMGDTRGFDSFHWHGETFSIPPGGTRILENAHCANQAFALGKHLGLQCHIEMTEELVRSWLRGGAAEMQNSAASPGVQSADEIGKNLSERVAALHDVADRVYDRWTEGLSR